MVNAETIRPGILHKILVSLGYEGSESDVIPDAWLEKVNSLNAYQLLDAFLAYHKVVGLTGDVIEALDELRSAVEHHV